MGGWNIWKSCYQKLKRLDYLVSCLIVRLINSVNFFVYNLDYSIWLLKTNILEDFTAIVLILVSLFSGEDRFFVSSWLYAWNDMTFHLACRKVYSELECTAICTSGYKLSSIYRSTLYFWRHLTIRQAKCRSVESRRRQRRFFTGKATLPRNK